jgi:hypothetical protein
VRWPHNQRSAHHQPGPGSDRRHRRNPSAGKLTPGIWPSPDPGMRHHRYRQLCRPGIRCCARWKGRNFRC